MRRLIKTSAFYKHYLADLYKKHKALAGASYKEQYDFIMADCFAWADFWKKHLEKTGRYEVEELIINNPHLQKQWAKEHGVRFDENNWMAVILEAQFNEFRPDIWFSHTDVNPEFRLKLRREHPKIVFVFGYDGTLKHDAAYFQGCDLMLSCIEDTTKYYRAHGYKSYFLPYAFERNILDKICQRDPLHEVSFVGSFYPFKGLHSKRLEFIAEMSKDVPLDIYSPAILNAGLKHYAWAMMKLIKNGQWKDISYAGYIDRHRKGTVFGLEMYQVLADSRMTLNFHGDIVTKQGGNMRLFEATGAGTCLVTDWKENLGDFFEEGREIVTFKTMDECLEKVSFLLAHEEQRKAIARAGQRRTLQEYSFENVLNKFLVYLEPQLK